MIKAIETVYNGYRFRSRLEARWAVFFDSVGIKYLYEPEGFEIETPDGVTRYLPDFYFPGLGVFGEVKGGVCSNADKEKIYWSAEGGGPCMSGILLLGEIPKQNQAFQYLFTLIYWYKGVWITPAVIDLFCEGRKKIERLDAVYNVGKLLAGWPDIPSFFDIEYPAYLDPCMNFSQTMNLAYRAFDAARMARFEHGENPIRW